MRRMADAVAPRSIEHIASFTMVQWILVGPLTALAFGSERWKDALPRATGAR